MKGIINFFNILVTPLAILIGVLQNHKYMWMLFALYSSFMFINITINAITYAIINKKYEEEYSVFWRNLFIIVSALSWTFVICN